MISPPTLRGPERVRSPFKMPVRRSSTIVALATLAILVLLYTTGISGFPAFDIDKPYHHHHDPHRSHHAPQGGGGGDTHPPPPPPPPPPGPPQPFTDPPFTDPRAYDPLCEGFPDTSQILLVMKTGASEAFARVPTQLMTALRCVRDHDVLFFGDLDQDIGGRRVHDSLATVRADASHHNADFDLYRRQQRCLVDQEACNKPLREATAKDGWRLDKYKNIHIAEKAWAMRPGYHWYVFVDADTYVLWPNLVRWLDTLDSRKELYLGSWTAINDFIFGHGGSGYILSRAAMENFVGKNPGVANEYDLETKNHCCGDYVFAKALKAKTGVDVQQMWPTINGEKPSTLPFGPTHWCHPVVTMHHMNAEEINTFWHFERLATQHLAAAAGEGRTPRPLLLRDIYGFFLAPHLFDNDNDTTISDSLNDDEHDSTNSNRNRIIPNATRLDWDNLADDRFYVDAARNPADADVGGDDTGWWNAGVANHAVNVKQKPGDKEPKLSELEKVAHRSAEDCARACADLDEGKMECFRWRYRDGACVMGKSFVLGKPVSREEQEGKRVVSGWEVGRIKRWIEKQGRCRKVVWPTVK